MILPPRVLEIIEEHCGIDVSVLGKVLIETLVNQRKEALELKENSEYFLQLEKNSQELDRFIEGLLVPETWFFRDWAPFEFLKQWLREKNILPPLRILSVPCATGEETYSIAIALREAGWKSSEYQIIAADLLGEALEHAKKGIYKEKAFREKRFKKNHFTEIEEQLYKIDPDLKESITFVEGNLTTPLFLKDAAPFDVIFCRNMLIYLLESARQKVISNLDRLLNKNGLLILGHADNIHVSTNNFKLVGPANTFAYARVKKPKKKPPIKSLTKLFSPSTKKLPPQKKPEPKVQQPTDTLEHAKQLADKSQLEASIVACLTILETDPTSSGTYLLLGSIYNAQNNLKNAKDALKKSVYLDNNNIDALILLELTLKKIGEDTEASQIRNRITRLEAK